MKIKDFATSLFYSLIVLDKKIIIGVLGFIILTPILVSLPFILYSGHQKPKLNEDIVIFNELNEKAGFKTLNLTMILDSKIKKDILKAALIKTLLYTNQNLNFEDLIQIDNFLINAKAPMYLKKSIAYDIALIYNNKFSERPALKSLILTEKKPKNDLEIAQKNHFLLFKNLGGDTFVENEELKDALKYFKHNKNSSLAVINI